MVVVGQLDHRLAAHRNLSRNAKDTRQGEGRQGVQAMLD